MKKTKKIAAMLLAAALLVTTSIAGTMAYLTSKTDKVVNSFTVGKVSFDAEGALDEAKVDEYGNPVESAPRVTDNTYKLIPGHKYVKDPTVHMSDDTEDAYLFINVSNGIGGIEKNGEKTIQKQILANGWKPLEGNLGVYYLEAKAEAGKDYVVFKNFEIATDAAVENYTDAEITVEAYAIQAESFESAEKAWEEVPLKAWENA